MFDQRTFVPDIHAINTSLPVRQGKPIGAAYQRSVEEMGGYPATYFSPQLGKNELYWSVKFGAFMNHVGWRQGDIVTDKRLVGYITVRRIGDLIFYPSILGHGDFLEDGIMALMHFHILRWCTTAENPHAKSARVLMYTNADPPNEGLRIWKKRAGI